MSAGERVHLEQPRAAVRSHRGAALATLLLPRLQSAGLPIALLILIIFFSVK